MEQQVKYKSGAIRNSKGKLRLDLITPEMETALGEILTMGADKYGDRNWEKGIDYMSYIGSCKRHMNAWLRGEDNDKESGFNHIKHAMTNLGMLITTIERYPELDDRFKLEKHDN